MSLSDLDREERLRLMKFVVSFAWADLEVKDEERDFVRRLIKKLALDDTDRGMVEEWLEVPPRAEEVDPADIPVEHRQLFLDAIRAMIVADGRVDQDEAENLVLLEALLVAPLERLHLPLEQELRLRLDGLAAFALAAQCHDYRRPLFRREAGIRIEGRWQAGPGRIDGSFSQGPFEAPLSLRRVSEGVRP